MKRSIIAGSALALVAAVAVPMTSHAALETRCTGEGGAVTVPGDLVVPAGQSCALTGTIVQGDVRVAPGASLVADGVTVEGNVVVTADGYLDLVDSTVAGNVTNRGGYGVYLDGSTATHYTGVAGENPDTFLAAYESDLSGRVSVTGGSFLLESSTVARASTVADAYYADTLDSVVGGAYTVSGAEYGAMVCGSEIEGAASFADNAFGVQLGRTGPLGVCEQGDSYWGSSVDVSGTAGEVRVVGNIVRGDLSGTGNEPIPVAGENRVRGQILGQFAEAAPAGERSMTGSRVSAAVRARGAVEDLRSARTDAALDAAQQAGPAAL